jgi:hypothetical protein
MGHLAEQLVPVSVELSVKVQGAADKRVVLGVAAGAELLKGRKRR